MAPKRKNLKRKAKCNDGMNLRSGSIPGRQVTLEDGFSRAFPTRSPAKNQGRKVRKCPFVDDEASVDRFGEEDPSFVEEEATTAPTGDVIPQIDITLSTSGVERQCDSQGQDAGGSNVKHNRFFGQEVSLGLISDVMGKFYVMRSTEPPLVPLCRLLPTDAVRVAESDASWLIPLFDRAGYVKTMASFIVSLKGRHGETKLVTHKQIEKWDPIWQQLNGEFEAQLIEEWKNLCGKFFHVYDGNNRVKTWEKRIEESKYKLLPLVQMLFHVIVVYFFCCHRTFRESLASC